LRRVCVRRDAQAEVVCFIHGKMCIRDSFHRVVLLGRFSFQLHLVVEFTNLNAP